MAKSDPAVLRRLGPVPFWRGEQKCLDALRTMYERAQEFARRRLAKEPAETPSSAKTDKDTPQTSYQATSPATAVRTLT